ncbi:hypothetical protein CONCODRAFT_71753 [Conidiobolus coronatus NRRL 28638]|uniref:Cytochrome c oxidase assembly protein COX20, mitochondrial n=1 Tax=Conidiobolus coronatus (strain ATCC 28846 / CBS 209.66 / NRRL 28638) TaxID=796925 RepID=A0A137P224_CONC2|nr:hypothetical protein CONCODRAFT_71753 [Conidiobolus coronatus NRRL 28638]|eukprot:KXN69100.1 hypothetical protein CONCODRAFT_71753 [Conidiobolus coronatus NRRL 28638]
MSESNNNNNTTPEFEKPSGIEPVAKKSNNLQQPTLSEAFQTLDVSKLPNVIQAPCARSSLLYGIGGGTLVGFGKYLLNKNVLRSANWSVGSFAFISLVTWEYCRYQWRIKENKYKVLVNDMNAIVQKKRQRELEKLEASGNNKSE